MKILSENKCFGGVQGVYSHDSRETSCPMTFAVFLPPQANNTKVPLLWYLSGLTCSHQNVMDKGEYRRLAAELGVAIVCPDTSPRGLDVADEPDNWQFGQGAGFYLDATQAPYDKNYRMYSYILSELPELIGKNFAVDLARQSIFGHSMGGHGALIMALKNPNHFKSVSAFAPIVEPSTADWSRLAFEKYLGEDTFNWHEYDAVSLIEDGARVKHILVDQGTKDTFLDTGLRPWLLQEACENAGINLTLNMREGYDHSYYFVSTFMDEHIKYHAHRLFA